MTLTHLIRTQLSICGDSKLNTTKGDIRPPARVPALIKIHPGSGTQLQVT